MVFKNNLRVDSRLKIRKRFKILRLSEKVGIFIKMYKKRVILWNRVVSGYTNEGVEILQNKDNYGC